MVQKFVKEIRFRLKVYEKMQLIKVAEILNLSQSDVARNAINSYCERKLKLRKTAK